MSEVKFTKGEWVTDGEWITCEGSAICIMGDSWVSFDNCKANSHLIASAPDMYNNLLAVSDFLESMHYVDYQLTIRESIKLKKEVDTLLAKARGE